MCLSWPAVNYSDAETINHIGLMSTPEKPSDGVLGAFSPLQSEQRGSSDNSWGSCNSVAKHFCPDFWQNTEEMLNPHIFRGWEIRAEAHYVNERQNALCTSGCVSSSARAAGEISSV